MTETHSNLVPCPDCGHQVSNLAPACPNCGRPLAAQTIEKTSKRFKAMGAIGVLLAICSAIPFYASMDVAVAQYDAETNFETYTPLISAHAFVSLGIIMLIGGFVIAIVRRVASWWDHG